MGYFAETFNDIYQSLNEEGHRIGADRDSSNLKKIKKWYKEFCTASKTKAENKQQIDERLKVLKLSKKEMEETLNNSNGRYDTEKALYIMKSSIPFNNIARVIDKQDAYAKLKITTSVILTLLVGPINVCVGPLIRYLKFDDMLKDMIKDTDDAIKFLEEKKKEL